MPTKTYNVPNINCGHCVMTIERELGEMDGVQSVKGDPGSKSVTVSWDEGTTSWEEVESLMREINYPPAG